MKAVGLSSNPVVFSVAFAFSINHLTGRAQLWGTAGWDCGTPARYSFRTFSAELCRIFCNGAEGSDAEQPVPGDSNCDCIFLYILSLILMIGVSLPYVMLFCIARLIISKMNWFSMYFLMGSMVFLS